MKGTNMTEAPTAYPLAWPPGRPRTTSRVEGKFHATLDKGDWRQAVDLTRAEARGRLMAELKRLNAERIVVSSNERDSRTEPRDPGVAVYFLHWRKPIVLA